MQCLILVVASVLAPRAVFAADENLEDQQALSKEALEKLDSIIDYSLAKQWPDVDLEDSTLLEQQATVRELRQKLEKGASKALTKQLDKAVQELHSLPAFQSVGRLNISRHRYGTDRLLADAATITSYQKKMLLHGKPVVFVDAPSMLLPKSINIPISMSDWAVYNPSVLPYEWAGQKAYLITYRLSTWNLCTWEAVGSPLDQLPTVEGKKRVTSTVGASIVLPDFKVALSMQLVEGIDHEQHYCTHHTGMIRMGVDDARLFTLQGQAWIIYAAVAPKGRHDYCFHNLFLCPLSTPSPGFTKFRCQQKIPLRFDRADEISEEHRAAGRLPNVHQKNWVPFVDGENLYLVFTIEPLTVVQVDVSTGECREISQTKTAAMKVFHKAAAKGQHSTMGLHGGSPLISLPEEHGGGFLGIGRIARGNTQYALFFYVITLSTTNDGDSESMAHGFSISRTSRIFCFASTSPHHRGLCETIQFAGGLMIKDDGSLIVTYGTNDCEAKVAFLRLTDVLAMFGPTVPTKSKKQIKEL